jgi:hypothetical protein
MKNKKKKDVTLLKQPKKPDTRNFQKMLNKIKRGL